jgi:V8-like Glu-specific endopeptidase
MVTNYKEIETIPEVQVVMNMDGWGAPAGKTSIYKEYIEDEPVEFTGIKLFYKNDTTSGSTMMTTDQILKLTPEPIYIQYQ